MIEVSAPSWRPCPAYGARALCRGMQMFRRRGIGGIVVVAGRFIVMQGRGAVALPVSMPLPGPCRCRVVTVVLHNAVVVITDAGGNGGRQVPGPVVSGCLSWLVRCRRVAWTPSTAMVYGTVGIRLGSALTIVSRGAGVQDNEVLEVLASEGDGVVDAAGGGDVRNLAAFGAEAADGSQSDGGLGRVGRAQDALVANVRAVAAGD